jgi:hypothetical protein
LSSLFPPLRQVAPPAQKFVDERPLLSIAVPYLIMPPTPCYKMH